ncbi:DNA replication/repair protein RecF [Alteribacillus iranensis]|uniref:DNA replication and repair protein RecF n=1 Tax=Alteribacillus iranensis TaxID=930128 RepID=A0A1I2C5Q0_9BACI|nr:DNA replication/repair protein RecF [Alteribacillus iranensis]SFE63701.1 DNA replication and repair protein RecF [Alteribacillus iranensis]
MHINSLHLKQFRNYNHIDLPVENKINLILGENAQGKTNMMEAVYVLAFAKSHRTSKDKELIQWEEDFARIGADFSRKSGPTSLEVIISSKGKKTKVNGMEQRKLSEYIGALNVVMFAPEDLNLVKGGPQMRRRFIDMEIGQISPVYLYDLSLYQRILKQRNQLLKDMFPVPEKEQEVMLEVLSDQLAQTAAKVIQRRFVFLEMLQEWSADIHKQISREREELQVAYIPTAQVSEEMDLSMLEVRIKEKLEHIRQNEIRRGVTLIGPHRDELSLKINGKEVQTFGSQGQQRTAALSLKLAEIELINEHIGEYPILLLDDVLSELDNHRQSHLLHAIQGKVQTFVTATSVEGIEHETIKKASAFQAEKGTLRQMK